MIVRTTATVEYVCYLSDEDTDKVIQYADAEGCTLKEAVANLHADGTIDLYNECSEVDFSTESIDSVEG